MFLASLGDCPRVGDLGAEETSPVTPSYVSLVNEGRDALELCLPGPGKSALQELGLARL